jgi:folate-binding protein YgfZ
MTPVDELEVLRTGAGVVDRSDRGAVLVTGPDAVSFLQALVSADLDPVVDGQGARSLLLTPHGKLDVAFRLLRVGDDAWLDSDPGTGEQLAASLNRFRIRVKAEVIERTADWGMVSVIGPAAADAIPGAHPQARHEHVAIDGARLLRTEHGFDIAGPQPAVDAITRELTASGVAAVGPAAYDAFRIEAGIPLQPLDIDDRTIPQEAFLELEAVSFTKGCFLGQELVCRIDSRGHVNRFLRHVTGIEGDWPERGTEIVVEGKVVGEITTVAPRELGVGALGYVRREIEPGTVADLRSESGTARALVTAIATEAPAPGS